jgi:PKD repeat protein
LTASFRKLSIFLAATIFILTATLCFQPISLADPAPAVGDYIVTEPSAHKLAMITPGGVRTEIYSFAPNQYPYGIAIDGAGNYIVTEFLVPKLAMITPGGVRTEIYSFAPNTRPEGVAIDGAGNYIVTEYDADKLSMITPGGVRTEIYSFAADTHPHSVAIDGAGNYIVTEYTAKKLSMITPGGVRTEIYSFAPNQGPAGVAIDGAGNYIVVEYVGGKLSMITPGGVRTVIYDFGGLIGPNGIAIDGAGNYIVTEYMADKLAMITPGGVRTEIYSFAADTYPFGVAIVTVENRPPELNPISGPDTVYRGDIVQFHVAGHDPDGDYPLYYEWYVNGYLMLEGAGVATLTFEHTMEAWSVGENVVSVRVTDSLGAYTEVDKTWTTLNHAPTVSGISGDTSGYRDIEYSWSATGSDAEDDDLTYEWYVDGELKSESSDSSFTYTFDSGDSIGSHTISVRVKDEIGDYSDYSTLNFNLQETPTEDYDLTVSVSGSGTTSPSAGIHTYQEGTGVSVTASPSSGWTFSHWLLDSVNVGSTNPYSLTMNDDHTLTAVFTEVPQEPPEASFMYSPPDPLVNDTITFDASGCSDADGTIVSYSWDFGDGDTSTNQNPTHAYDQEGSYVVTLTVTDDDGLTDTTTASIADVIPEFPLMARSFKKRRKTQA